MDRIDRENDLQGSISAPRPSWQCFFMARATITSLNRSPLVQVLTWLFFFVSLFFLIVRQVTRNALKAPFKIEDYLITFAMALSLAQTIATSAAASNGVGKTSLSLAGDKIDTALRASYAANLLLIACLGVTKLSIVFFLKSLSPDVAHGRHSYALGFAILAWLLIAVLTSLFQCAPPAVWDIVNGKHCMNLTAWWTFVAIGNIATDVAIVVLQSLLLHGLQISRKSKLLLLSIFSFRLLTVGAAIGQLVTYYHSLDDTDITLRAWLPTIMNEVTQSISITTACVPHIKRFLESLESGMIRVEEPRENAGSYKMRSVSGNQSNSRSGHSQRSV